MIESVSFRSKDGTRLKGFKSSVDNPSGVVFICHGHGEHCRRYDHVTAALNDKNLAVYACDLRGHGQSSGKRGHILDWQDYVEDIASLFKAAEDDGLENSPWVQLGHSMGGLVAIHVALAYQDKLAGLALSGPLLGIAAEVPALKAFAGNMLSKYVPGFSMATGLDANLVSRDSDEVAAYAADMLVHDRVSTRWFTEMTAAIETAQRKASELTLPVWLAHGTADGLTDVDASRQFASKLGSNLEAHFLDGYYHEIFNEPLEDRTKAIQLFVDWIVKTIT